MRVSEASIEDVHGIHATESLAQAVTAMLRSHASALSIFADDDSLIGVLIEGDLREHHELDVEKHRALWKDALFGHGKRAVLHMHVESRCYVEIKTHGVATFAEAASLRGAVDIMKRNNIWRLPVMMGDRLLGFLVGANLVGALAVLTPASDHPANDANTRNSILAALDRGGDASARVALNRTVH